MAGIASLPVEGRIGAMIIGKDQSFGSGEYQAGIIGGTPTVAGIIIPIPTQGFKRLPTAAFVRRP